ncbi:sodium/potassium-transporting ATPase subunit beta-1-interacting protein 1 isoform X1 [Strongylocentrotus purpuratus]|uniref:Sodium/potassium-transporting ATPase subunit beta-1-interacting protein n=1 Tax=Strongylocentrotus purpuratus TaxID=7668 RepID=A0A7M7LVV8_STRPU|nr:sodium/potassium-transporting ATPase subunit beta-1-interacting protein 1 isoform X1 [Strongylocentrotus purpuratus]
MGCCTRQCSMITLCILQLIATTERLVFDFLGFMWVPMLVGFFNIIFVLFGIFGSYQYRPKFMIVYSLWQLLWLGWNIFIICLYLEAGILSLEQHQYMLTFNTSSSESWWIEHGFNCSVTYNITTLPSGISTSERIGVTGCLLDYRYIEVIHAAVQCFLCVLGIAGAMVMVKKFNEEEDSFDFIGGFDSSYTAYNSHAQKPPATMQLEPIYVDARHRGLR